jgi:hypothetical protein
LQPSACSISQFISLVGFLKSIKNRVEAPDFHLGAGLSRLTTDEKLQGAFAPFGRLLEGTKQAFFEDFE